MILTDVFCAGNSVFLWKFTKFQALTVIRPLPNEFPSESLASAIHVQGKLRSEALITTSRSLIPCMKCVVSFVKSQDSTSYSSNRKAPVAPISK